MITISCCCSKGDFVSLEIEVYSVLEVWSCAALIMESFCRWDTTTTCLYIHSPGHLAVTLACVAQN